MVYCVHQHQKWRQKQNQNMFAKSVNITSMHFNVRIVRDLTYVSMKNKKVHVKHVADQVYAPINELYIIA